MKTSNKFKILRRIVRMKHFVETLCGLIVTCTVIFIILLTLVNWIFNEPNEFGDSAGAVNGLFSALAFAGVIYAIFLQRKELSLQRQELKETRKEIAGQRQEAEVQNVTLKRQRFENTFFQMISLQQRIVNGLNFSYEKKITILKDTDQGRYAEDKPELRNISGRDLFRFSFEEVIHKINGNEYKGIRDVLLNFDIQGYEDSYTPTYFDHYFRCLYRIIKFVDETDLIKDENPVVDFETRYQYTSIVRGQLSRYELVWLFYNGLSCYGRDKFKPLIEKYALLKNIREDLLVHGTDDLGLYETGAFEKTLIR